MVTQAHEPGSVCFQKPTCFFCVTREPTTVKIFTKACLKSFFSNASKFGSLSQSPSFGSSPGQNRVSLPPEGNPVGRSRERTPLSAGCCGQGVLGGWLTSALSQLPDRLRVCAPTEGKESIAAEHKKSGSSSL